MTADLNRALERLRGDDELLLYVAGDYRDLAQPLAALIDDLSLGDRDGDCSVCGHDMESHAPDCALIQLVDAINGTT